MKGILAYGAYIPFHRLKKKTIAEAYGEKAVPGEKAVANFDEDSLSMGVEASLDCLKNRDDLASQIEAVYFATTTPSYDEKQGAVTIAAALDLPREIRTADIGHSLRASSTALLEALDYVSVHGKSALVISSDCRLGGAQGMVEQMVGDGAGALLVGTGDEVIANVLATYSNSLEHVGQWRSHGESFVRNWEDRFIQTIYMETIRKTILGLTEKSGIRPEEINKVIITGPHARAQLSAARVLGLNQDQFVQGLELEVGHTGTAQGPMMLISVLEQANPRDKILYLGYGEGCDAVLFEVTERILQFVKPLGIKGHLEHKDDSLLYTHYLKWKGMLPLEPGRRPEPSRPSAPAMQRNYHQNLVLYGSKCTMCGTPQFPKQRVCTVCQAKDQMEDYRFYGKKARVTTYTIDYLALSLAPPTIFAVIDFEGGGRMLTEVTDCTPGEIDIGLEVDMTFRRLYHSGGIHNYFWKAKPKR
ncbi:OB-fold domain-containing protein [Microaerobacter geothermalis]|uniref:OB-fold domain-containing protein n=1 Tax=Microaerobacter geothermalis TaxID=674972 RepID=UPI001F164F0A|nr:OB-fold domain-containing protein [Microaerobacter geothermalis]MCF6095299.1 OB-fold domain-containing protein [Microaerobacter geothermalis]